MDRHNEPAQHRNPQKQGEGEGDVKEGGGGLGFVCQPAHAIQPPAQLV